MRSIFLILLFFSFHAEAQQHFVVNLSGDTLFYDVVKVSNKGITCKIKGKENKVYHPLELKIFKDALNIYAPVKIDNKKSGAPSFFKDGTIQIGIVLAYHNDYKFIMLNVGANAWDPVGYDYARFWVTDATGTTIKWICTPSAGGCPIAKFDEFKKYFDINCAEYKKAYAEFAAKPKNVQLFHIMLEEQRACKR